MAALWSRPTPAERLDAQRVAALRMETQRAAVERAERLAELRAQQAIERSIALEPIRRAARAGWELLPLVALGAAGVVLLDVYRRRRQPLVYASADGLLPLARAFVHNQPEAALALLGAYQESRGAARIEAARHAAPPQHYAPVYSPAITYKVQGGDAAQLAAPSAMPSVPTFAALLAEGAIGAAKPIVIGYGALGDAVTIERGKFASTMIGGVSGAGKTTTARSVAGQWMSDPTARLAVIDPHADSGEESLLYALKPLASRFLCPPSIRAESAARVAFKVKEEMDARLHGSGNRAPLLLMVDEWPKLCIEAGPEVNAALEAVANEGRKVNVFAVALGQRFNATRTGGTETRSGFGCVIAHRLPPEQVRILFPRMDLPRASLALQDGEALVYRAGSGEIVAAKVPYCGPDDLVRVAGRLPPPTVERVPSASTSERGASEGGGEAEVEAPPPEWEPWPEERDDYAPPIRMEGEALPPASTATQEELRALVAERLEAGEKMTGIIREVWGVSGGRAWAEARAEYLEIARELGR